ncbi:MAG: RNA-binding domain-containing protein [Halobacteriales archaeon]|nr:RNA-binding domain-containing protein [Halobacteriales archaeon]
MTDAYRISVEVTAPLYPTELPERVEQAITALFPEAEVSERPGELVGEARAMERFAERLHEQEIVDAARDVFRRNVEGDAFAFALKKQAAYEGVVNFAVGNPDELGDLQVRVRVEEPSVEAFIDGLAPPSDER